MKKSTKKAAEIGAGVIAAAALAATAAYWVSEKATKEQKTKAKAWIVKAKKEIARNITAARNFGEGEYIAIVDRAVKKYGSLEKVSVGDIIKTAQDLKAEWNKIKTHAKAATKTSAKNPKRRVAKTTRSATPR